MSQTGSLTEQQHQARQHRTDVDGLRAVAVISVLAFHTHTRGFSGGFAGVDIFFVISGYLICSIIVREIEADNFSVARFYERRCKRILPALFVVLLFCVAASLLILSPAEAKQLGNGVIATALSISNVQFYLRGSYFDHGGMLNPLLMTWSLAVEEQFYILFPLLMLLLYKRNRRHLLGALSALCCFSFLLSVYCEFKHPEFNFYLPFTRAWELGAGTLLAVWQLGASEHVKTSERFQNAMGLLGVLMVATCITLYSPATRFPGFEAVLPVFGTIFLLASPSGLTNQVLGWRPLGAIGLISYSLYLWHWPLLSFATIVCTEPLTVSARVTLMLVATALATLSYFLIETPFRTARYSSRPKVLVTYVALIAMFLGLGCTLTRTSGFSQRVPALAEVEDSLEMERAHPCISAASRGLITSANCVPAPTSSPTVALLGDSHAEALAPAFKESLSVAGEHLILLASFSCPPLKDFTRALPDQPVFASACAALNTTALNLLSQRPDVKTVILAGAWTMVNEDKFVPIDYRGDPSKLSTKESGRNLVLGLASEVHALEALGKRVIVIDDVPSLSFNPVDIVRENQLPIRRLLARLLGDSPVPIDSSRTVRRSESVTPTAEAVRSALIALTRKDARLSIVDTKNILCTATDCTYLDGSNLFYTDNNHLSHFGATKILSGVQTTFRLGG